MNMPCEVLEPLTSNQRDCLEFCNRANEIAFIEGASGSGKSFILANSIYQSILQGKRAIVYAYSNNALDSLIEMLINKLESNMSTINLDNKGLLEIKSKLLKIGKLSKCSSKAQSISIDKYVHKDNDIMKQKEIINLIKKKIEIAKPENLKLENQNLEKAHASINGLVKQKILDKIQIFFCSGLDIFDPVLREYLKKSDLVFDIAYLDEFNCIPEYLCWVPILMSKKIVVAADEMQKKHCFQSPKIKAETESLLNRFKKGLNEKSFFRLIDQHRMKPEIFELACQDFHNYQTLANPTLLADPKQSPLSYPLITIEISNKCFEERYQNSIRNIMEADIIINLLKELKKLGFNSKNVGVISPYKAQLDLIKTKLTKPFIDVDLINWEKCSGIEKEVIIISMVRSNKEKLFAFPAQLPNYLAFSRSKSKLIVVWNSLTFEEDPYYSKLNLYLSLNSKVLDKSFKELKLNH